MRNGIKLVYVLGIILLCIIISWACKGGKVPELGGIEGPDSIAEYEGVEFRVSLNNATGATFLWSCDPPDAGQFETPETQKTDFTASMVPQDTPVRISVVVESQQFEPVIITKDITIKDMWWSRTWGGSGMDYGYDIAVDGSGNAYITGSFISIPDFDPGPGVDEHASHGMRDIFLSKFDSSGNFVWARTWGAHVEDTGYGVAIDGSGNAYVTGCFKSSPDFDPGPEVDYHSSHGGWDIFLSKFDSSGNFLWARTWGGDGDDTGYGIAIDGSGNAYVTGMFRYTVDFDPGPGADEHISNGDEDIFLSKFDSSGNFQWARTWGGPSEDSGTVATDGSDNIYVIGHFSDTVDFDSGPGVDERVSNGDVDTFMSKFDSSGIFQDALTWGGSSADFGYGVAFDGSGNTYVTGCFISTVDFDPGPGVNEHTANGVWGYDIFLSKFDSLGDFQWVRTLGGSAWDYGDTGTAVAVDGNGNAYVTGMFGYTVDFDPGPGVDEHKSNGYFDVFLSKFPPDGNW